MDEFVTRQTLLDCGACEPNGQLGEMRQWLCLSVAHAHEPAFTAYAFEHAHKNVPAIHDNPSNDDDVRWSLPAVVAALEKSRPKFGGIDGLDWLVAHDKRAKKYLKPEDHSVKVFDATELRVGDKFSAPGSPFTRFSHGETESRAMGPNDTSESVVDFVGSEAIHARSAAVKHVERVFPIVGLRGHIARVMRGGVQIYPRPACPFKPSDKVIYGSDAPRTVTKVYWQEIGPVETQHWRVMTEDGMDAPDTMLKLAPKWEPKPGGVVEYHGSRFKVHNPAESGPYVMIDYMDGKYFAAADPKDLKPVEPS